MNNSCCSSEPLITPGGTIPEWVADFIDTPVRPIPRIRTELTARDRRGSWKVRWGIHRMNYTVTPGLYAVGQPDANSPVLVSANYKLSFDMLRKELTGLNLWILVIDTKGINVWCAAGKGTFGTKEIIKRIYQTRLTQIIQSRTLLLPQLGAPGVEAHTVRRATGFKVIYGPVRAADISAFLAAGMQATPAMRRVEFPLRDRAVLTPIEVVASIKPLAIILAVLFALQLIQPGTFSIVHRIGGTLASFAPFLGAALIGAVLTPILLPWIPGRAFAFKGWLLGLIWAIAVNLWWVASAGWLWYGAHFLVLPAISAFLAMNFTGSSTFTSLSGVQKEMKWALPAIGLSTGFGLILVLVDTVYQFIR